MAIWWEYASQCYIQGSHLQRARGLDPCVHSLALSRTYFPSMTPLVHTRVDPLTASSLCRAKTLSSTSDAVGPISFHQALLHVDGPTYFGTHYVVLATAQSIDLRHRAPNTPCSTRRDARLNSNAGMARFTFVGPFSLGTVFHDALAPFPQASSSVAGLGGLA